MEDPTAQINRAAAGQENAKKNIPRAMINIKQRHRKPGLLCAICWEEYQPYSHGNASLPMRCPIYPGKSTIISFKDYRIIVVVAYSYYCPAYLSINKLKISD